MKVSMTADAVKATGRRVMSREGKRGALILCVLSATLLAVLATIAPSAMAAEAHNFDPTLSLTGRCTTEAADSVSDPWCPGPPGPSAPFEISSIAIDFYGDVYVGSFGNKEDGSNGRVDVFSPQGEFITEFSVPGGPRAIAVDTKGNFYAVEYGFGAGVSIKRYSPKIYKPGLSQIDYSTPGVVVVPEISPELKYISGQNGLAVDPSTNHLFVGDSEQVGEFSSADEGNKFIETFGSGTLSDSSKYVAIDSSRNRLFISDGKSGAGVIWAFELKAPHKLLGTIDGSQTPAHVLQSGGALTVDADEKTGHIFVSDLDSSNKVYEFGDGLGEMEEYLATYQRKFIGRFPGEVAIDNSPTSPNRGTLYIPSGGAIDHAYAFKYVATGPPAVESTSFSGVTEDEAVLRAKISPEGLTTSYRFEYTTQQSFEEDGFASATLTGEETLAAGIVGEDALAPVAGLEPDTSYRFRAFAVNEDGEDQGEGHFRTHSSPAPSFGCPNEALRSGLSARLPDCRAYELVSPPDTNGRAPLGVGKTGVYFPTLEASPQGDKATFRVEGGSLPGSDGSGAFSGENYLSTRRPEGWTTALAAPSGAESSEPLPGSVSPDQEYSFWGLPPSGEAFRYLRYPNGHSELVGRGSLATDPKVIANLIAEHGAHVIFTTTNTLHIALQLEPNAPPDGTTAVYDRTEDGVTHVVSLLPGDITPAAGQNASYVGSSYDGRDIAFSIGGKLYLRHDNQATYEIGEESTFAGVANERVFSMKGGDLFAFDVPTKGTIKFSESGDVVPVNIAGDGSTAYLISPSVLSPEPNPNGAIPQAGAKNLYVSQEGVVHFVATVTTSDVEGNPLNLGLGSWIQPPDQGQVGLETSRASQDGSVLLFQSEAALAGYDPEGFTEIYRYDGAAGSLKCLSCNPTEAPAASDASLQTVGLESTAKAPVSAFARMPNLSPDGRRAIFESSEPLVLGDTDGVQDVYEWEAQGVGGCTQSGGCTSLISSGQSARNNYLFSVSEDGDDVFFSTSDLLLSEDRDETPSIYDARVGGGFAPPPAPLAGCLGEACQPSAKVPDDFTPASSRFEGAGNVAREPTTVITRCPKGKRLARKNGKARCVRHRKKHDRTRNQSRRRAVT